MTRTTRLLVFFILVVAVQGRAHAGEIFENESHTGPKTTIRYALWGGASEVEYTREICRGFVKAHPGIRVDVAVYPWNQYWSKMQTQAASGLGPDVWSLYSGNMGVWIARGALRPLDDLVESTNLPLSDYHRAAVENCTWEGRLYCMPMEIPVRTMVFALDRFEESGIPRDKWPRPDKAMSWEEFHTLAERLTLRRPDGSFAQYGMAARMEWNMSMFLKDGGRFFDRMVNPTESVVATGSELERAMIAVYQAQYGDRSILGMVPLSSGFFISQDTILLSRKFAMSMTGPWALPQLKEAGVRFGLTPLPRGKEPSQLIQVNAVGIYAHSKQVEAAWAFVRYMASGPVQRIFGRRLKGVPALIEAQDALIENDLEIEGCEAFIKDLEVARPYLMTSSSYVPSALQKWLLKTEQTLQREYDRRLDDLPRVEGRVPPDEYVRFVSGMETFVAKTVHERLPLLDAELTEAFARQQRPEPGRLVRFALPILFAVLIAGALMAYVRWVRRRGSPNQLGYRRSNAAGLAFLSPWLIGFVFFMVGPILAALYLSFTEWNMIRPPRWVGLQHYVGLPVDDHFLIGLQRTFFYVLLVVPISLFGGLFTAGLLTCNIRGRDAFKAIFYFPSLFTGAAVAVLWVNMFNREYGVVNHLLSFAGIGPVNWLDERHAFFTVILMNVFWIGGAMIIYYAGMRQIPRVLYESAEMDGAGPVRRFIYVTIPMLSPVILFMVIITTIGAFQVFTPALFFAPSATAIGAPGDALRFYSVNIYDEAFNNLRMGRACSYALILFLIIFLVTMLQMRLARRFVHTETER